jgi:hypothetical protein
LQFETFPMESEAMFDMSPNNLAKVFPRDLLGLGGCQEVEIETMSKPSARLSTTDS